MVSNHRIVQQAEINYLGWVVKHQELKMLLGMGLSLFAGKCAGWSDRAQEREGYALEVAGTGLENPGSC